MKDSSKNSILNLLNNSAKDYYNNKEVSLSDEAYDLMKDYVDLDEDKSLNDGVDVDITSPVERSVPMLSLAKIKTDRELEKFYERFSGYAHSGFVVEPKIDGLAISIEYNQEGLKRISTRGTGVIGEDITYIVRDKNLDIDGLNTKPIFGCNDGELRGELYITKSSLKKLNTSRELQFKHERGAVASIVRKSKLGLDYKAEVSFRAYSAYSKDGKEIEIPQTQKKSRDLFPKNISQSVEELKKNVSLAKNWRESLDTPTDGVVVATLESVDLGRNNHHPLNKVAYKYPTSEETTILKDVFWQQGKTGRLSPVGVIEPVVIDGVEISRVTLNNIDWIRENDVRINSFIGIVRSNDVIPKLSGVISNELKTTVIAPPIKCPSCDSRLEKQSSYIVCPKEDCVGKVKSRIYTYCSRNLLNIEGLGKEILFTIPVLSLEDLFSLTEDRLANSIMQSNVVVGESRAKKIILELARAKVSTPDYVWLAVLGFDSIGQITAKKILSKMNSIDNVLNATLEELVSIESVGELTAKSILRSQEKARETWSKLRELGVTVSNRRNSSILKGSFAITGKVPPAFKNRKEYVEYLENLGYSYHSSIKKDTDFLIIDDLTSESSKAKKARLLGVKLVKELI